MFEKSLPMKGRHRKRQTAPRKLREADNAHRKRKLKKQNQTKNNPTIKIREDWEDPEGSGGEGGGRGDRVGEYVYIQG